LTSSDLDKLCDEPYDNDIEAGKMKEALRIKNFYKIKQAEVAMEKMQKDGQSKRNCCACNVETDACNIF
tara:strand:+ start:316 stop:522 length:207 start_codon:yes stop_codon:yes gene_type:complete